MRYYEIANKPPKARLNALKHQKKQISAQIKNERDKDKRQQALANIQKNNEVLAKLRSNVSSSE